MNDLKSMIESSSLWAAYGDALGFITELTDTKGLKWRTGESYVYDTISWRRKVGGLTGAVIKFPKGTYSDDTQLRLATSRAIRTDGSFDVEAFAKIELPIWNAYALGGGRGTKDAAINLAKKNIRWHSNFYKGSKSGRDYTQSGGNGAAMRIQPHVWAGVGRVEFDKIAKDVIRNCITTHGHPHAIIGAVFHALCLHETLLYGSTPKPETWATHLYDATDITLSIIENDADLSSVWMSQWEAVTKQTYFNVHTFAYDESARILDKVLQCVHDQLPYVEIIKQTDATNPAFNGSATLTSILALALAHISTRIKKDSFIEAINTLGTDTDTIGTMAGAMIGATGVLELKSVIQDQDYILGEAQRLFDIPTNRSNNTFQYPSLLTWNAPAKISNLILNVDHKLIVSGLGEVVINNKAAQSGNNTWYWITFLFGQSILLRTTEPIVSFKDTQSYYSKTSVSISESIKNNHLKTKALFDDGALAVASKGNLDFSNVIDASSGFNLAREGNFDAALIGEIILRLAKLPNFGVESASSFASLIAKTIIERGKRKSE
jgi:ADP-ribosylglycohydrolase